LKARGVILAGAVAAAIAAFGCSGPNPTEERSPGQVVFYRYCQNCHSLPRPDMKTDEEWPQFVERYGQRANLDSETRRLIAEYLAGAN
jgi:hypothetical protein